MTNRWLTWAVAGGLVAALGYVAVTSYQARVREDAKLATALKTGAVRTIDLGGGVKLEIVWIEPGSFMMGSSAAEADRQNHETQHRVTLTKGYWLGKYEVTQAQWAAVMGSNPSDFKGADLPVETVSWEDCKGFVQKLNQKLATEGGGFRLPTEAEWEYACRAGSEGRFCFGAGDSGLGDYAWYDGSAGGTTHAVGTRRANAWGLHDMHGNVWEWCEDWYGTTRLVA